MTREEYITFRDEDLRKRFYWCYSIMEKKHLIKKGYKYLFRCTHFKSGKYFWVFDKTDAIMADVKSWKKSKKKVSDEVIE